MDEDNYNLQNTQSSPIPHYQLPASIPKLRANKASFSNGGKAGSKKMNMDLLTGPDDMSYPFSKTQTFPW